MRFWQRLILVVLMVVACVLMVLPFIAFSTTDLGNPSEARWEEPVEKTEEGDDSEAQRTAVIAFDSDDSLERLYDLLGIPVRLSYWWLTSLAIALGIIYLLFMDHFYEEGGKDRFFRWVFAALGVQVLLVGVCLAAAVVNDHYFDVSTRIWQSIDDEELAERVIREASREQLAIPVLAAFAFVMYDFVIIIGTAGAVALIKVYDRHEAALSQHLQGHPDTVALRADGTIERIEYACRFTLFPFLGVVPERVVTGRLAWKEAARLLAGAMSRQAWEGLCRQFKISLSDLFDTVGTKTATSIVTKIGDSVDTEMEQHLHETVSRDAAASRAAAASLLQEVSDTTLRRFQQDLVTKVAEVILSHLSDFRKLALAFLQNHEASGATYVPHDGVAFPDGTKFCLAKGKAMVFVVEEKPQVRTVTFGEGYLEQPQESIERETEFQLAFPYVIFVVKVWAGQFSALNVYYSKRPLQSLQDTLHWPNLPNVYSDGSVCLNSFRTRSRTAAACVRAVISHFWQSSFNFTLTKQYRHEDNPVRNVRDWQRQSQQDPGFAVTANWRVADDRLGQVVERLLTSDQQDEVALSEQVVAHALDQAVGSLSALVQKTCSDIVIEKRYSKTVTNELAAHLHSLGECVLKGMRELLTTAVASTNGDVRHHYDFHVQRVVNEAITTTFANQAAAALLDQSRLPLTLYEALDTRSA